MSLWPNEELPTIGFRGNKQIIHTEETDMTINNEIIQDLLQDKSHNLWEKYNKKRLYLDFAKIVNLEIDRYNTGNISSAYLDSSRS